MKAVGERLERVIEEALWTALNRHLAHVITRIAPGRLGASCEGKGEVASMPHLFRVIVPVADIERAARFYARVLGNSGQRVSPGRHYFQCEGTPLACYDPKADGDGYDAKPLPEPLYLAVDDLEATYANATAAGASSAANPRSRNTLPLDRVSLALAFSIPLLPSSLHQIPVPPLPKLKIALRGLLGLLLEGVQYVHRLRETRDVEPARR